MSYEIVDYRPVLGFGSVWTVDVKVKTIEKVLFIFKSTKETWMSCGKDGQPRFYYKLMPWMFIPSNSLLIVDNREMAEQKIREFKQQNNWQHLKK